MRPIRAIIDIPSLLNNFSVVKKLASKSKIMAVLKANAYGHGLIEVAKALKDTDGISVLSIDEAERLRHLGFKKTILLLEGFFELSEVKVASELNLNITIHSQDQIDFINNGKPKVPLDIHLKINTGMNRLGFLPEEVGYLVETLSDNPYVGEITLMTHFANADEKEGIEKQFNIFNNISINYNLDCSVSNSAALLRYPEVALDWVRPGIMLYGASPIEDKNPVSFGLKPVMRLMSKIIAIQEISSGESVGYGSTFTSKKSMRIGIVACGYGDGYPRNAKIGTPVFVQNKHTHIIGRVSMDMLYVDLSDNKKAVVGSDVELWGENVSVDEVAKYCGTVGYELLCNISSSMRVHMDYHSA
jgi:alanine racemase